MANTFWQAAITGKPFVPPEPLFEDKTPKTPDDPTTKKVTEASLERMTGAVGMPASDAQSTIHKKDRYTKKSE